MKVMTCYRCDRQTTKKQKAFVISFRCYSIKIIPSPICAMASLSQIKKIASNRFLELLFEKQNNSCEPYYRLTSYQLGP